MLGRLLKALAVLVLLLTNSFSVNAVKKTSIKKQIAGSGKLHLVYVDSFHNKKLEPIIYKLDYQGQTKVAVFKDSLEKPLENTFIVFDGYEYNDKVYIESYKPDSKKFAILEGISGSSEVNGSHKVLVVKVSDGSNTPQYGYTDSQIKTYYSTGSNNLTGFYKEASTNKLNLNVEYLDEVLEVSGLCGDIFTPMDSTRYITAISKLDDVYEGLDSVSYVSFIAPSNQFCFSNAILGVASLGREVFNLNAGQARLGVNFINSSFVDLTNSLEYGLDIRYAVFHEFGHNLGMHHDNAHVCGRSILTTSCHHLEYGGSHSIMGYSPSYAHPNTTYKDKMNWLGSNEIRTLNQESFVENIKLSPVSSSSGTKMIKINRGDGIYYNVEFRKAIGYDGKILPTRERFDDGFLVYYDDPGLTNTVLLRPNLFSIASSMDFFLGDRYIDSQEALSLHRAALTDAFKDDVNDVYIIGKNLDTNLADIAVIKGPNSQSNFLSKIKDFFDIEILFLDEDEEIEPFTDYRIKLYFLDNPISVNNFIGDFIKEVQWDLNQDGEFETVGSPLSEQKFKFKGTEGESIRVKIIDNNDNEVIIESSEFQSKPSPLTGEIELKYHGYPFDKPLETSSYHRIYTSIKFETEAENFSGSHRYYWDMDGDGEFEQRTFKPNAKHWFNEAGTYTPAVKYVDPNTNTEVIKSGETLEVKDNILEIEKVIVNRKEQDSLEIPLNDSKATNVIVHLRILDPTLLERTGYQMIIEENRHLELATHISFKKTNFAKFFKAKVNKKNDLIKVKMKIPPKEKIDKLLITRGLDSKDSDSAVFNLAFGKISKRFFKYSLVAIPFTVK